MSMTHLVNPVITTWQSIGSSECVIYATLDFQETAFSANYWGKRHSQAPGSDTTWELHLTEFIVHRRGGRSRVIRNGGGGGMT